MQEGMNHIEQTIKDVFSGTFYGDESLLKNAPKQEGELVFFSLEKYISASDLQAEYDKRNLTPANPLELAKWCEKNQKVGKYYATQWNDNGYCCATFDRWHDERRVSVYRGGGGWGDGWSFAGVPQVASELETSESALTLETLNLRLKKLEALINPKLL
jgi:hypothetical protein